ncbi:hypothetical protein DFH08DRAFT_1009002 [Mycena albidolilacea]|uniref:Uncharacterized protein n=1 Tax=Mycena albidolilacea TaxID=1033008 RepID=A0AAD7EQ08_9AGAR|nr:hypothetical protein DFH08DRAFT_1009002 [Mycena albidolilacea]
MAPTTKELMERAKRRRTELQNAPPSSSTPSSPVFPATPSLPTPPAFNLDPVSGPFSVSPAANNAPNFNIRGISMAQLKNFGERELKRAPSKDERDTLQALWTLQVRDQLSKLTRNTTESWTPSSALEKASRRSIYSLFLLPNLQLYSGTLVDVLLLAMRAVNTPDLPNADSIHADELGTWLGEEISQARYAIKKKIIENARLNVAELAAELLSLVHAHHVPATLGLYMRLALLRRHIGLKHNANSFWGKVDQEMETFREGGSQDFVDLMQVIYEDDVREFGDPSTTGHTVKSFTDPNFTCPQWLRELFAVAPQVKRLPKQKGKNRKRKRSVTDVDENTGDNVRQNVDVQDAEGEGQPGAGEED